MTTALLTTAANILARVQAAGERAQTLFWEFFVSTTPSSFSTGDEAT